MLDVLPREALQDPYPYYARLRHEAPVCQAASSGVWTISRYVDVAFVLRNPRLFSSRIMAGADPYLLGADPPAHSRVRNAVSAVFSRRRLTALENRIPELAERLVVGLSSGLECDLKAMMAVPLPLAVVAELLGIGSGCSHVDLKRWSDAFVLSGSGAADPARMSDLVKDLQAFDAFVAALVAEHRRAPADDLVGVLAGCADPPLTDEEMVSLCRLLVIAGSETTTNLLGNALLAMLERPHLRERIAGDLTLVSHLIEETLRFDPPVQFLQRRVVQDVKVAGVAIPEGDVVIAILGSANRDENKFDAPDQFVLERESRDHLGFGTGPHACLGAPLARLESRIAVESLAPYLRTMELIEQPVPRIETLPLRGPQSLSVRL